MTGSPKYVRDSPQAAEVVYDANGSRNHRSNSCRTGVPVMDPLSDVFMAMRIKKASYTRLELTAPWGLSFNAYDHADFGLVTRGACWLSVQGDSRPVQLTAGDCWVLARGDRHLLRDSLESRVLPFSQLRSQKIRNVLRHGRGGKPTTIIAGNFSFDGQSGKWLTDLLPALAVVKDHRKTSSLRKTLQLLGSESEREDVGSAVVASRLADILFVQAIRAYVASEEYSKTGWLRPLSDRQIGLAIKSMHESIRNTWTLEGLASVAGMSRSAFAARFREIVGEPTLEYLTRWRMHKARQLLNRRGPKLAQVASLVGYDSEAAFNRAFKRVVGVAPGQYRKASGSV